MEEVQRKGGTREALCEFSAVQDTSSESAWPLNPPVANPARSPFTDGRPKNHKRTEGRPSPFGIACPP